MRIPLMAGNWKMYKTPAAGGGVRGAISRSASAV